MKKAIVLMLVLCLLLGVSSAALAAGAPKVTKQPVSQTTNSKGTVTFTFSAKNYSTNDSGWRFVNPATGEEYTGPQMRELLAANKGTLSVSNGKQKLTLTKVPESMHGWDVYFVLVNNGYTVYTDRVKLWCYGLAQTEATPTSLGEAPAANQPAAEQTAEPAEQQPQAPETVSSAPEQEISAGPKTVTVTVADKLTLIPLDSRGNEMTDQAASVLTFEDSGSVAVHSETPVLYWTVNGMKIEPSESISGFVLKNITADLAISAKYKQTESVPVEVDPNRPCQITCSGCVFTWHSGGLSSVSSGSVPYGASVIVVSSGADVSKGYTINGESGLHAGRASFMLTVTEDTSVSLP